MAKQCATCKHFSLIEFYEPDDPEAMGDCCWNVATLPYSLRYANRERVAVHVYDGITCQQYEEQK